MGHQRVEERLADELGDEVAGLVEDVDVEGRHREHFVGQEQTRVLLLSSGVGQRGAPDDVAQVVGQFLVTGGYLEPELFEQVFVLGVLAQRLGQEEHVDLPLVVFDFSPEVFDFVGEHALHVLLELLGLLELLVEHAVDFSRDLCFLVRRHLLEEAVAFEVLDAVHREFFVVFEQLGAVCEVEGVLLHLFDELVDVDQVQVFLDEVRERLRVHLPGLAPRLFRLRDAAQRLRLPLLHYRVFLDRLSELLGPPLLPLVQKLFPLQQLRLGQPRLLHAVRDLLLRFAGQPRLLRRVQLFLGVLDSPREQAVFDIFLLQVAFA